MAIIAGFDAVIPLMQRYAIDNFIIMKSTAQRSLLYYISLIIVIQMIIVKAMISYAGHVKQEYVTTSTRRIQSSSGFIISCYDTTPVGWMILDLLQIWRLGSTLA